MMEGRDDYPGAALPLLPRDRYWVFLHFPPKGMFQAYRVTAWPTETWANASNGPPL